MAQPEIIFVGYFGINNIQPRNNIVALDVKKKNKNLKRIKNSNQKKNFLMDQISYFLLPTFW